MIPFIKWFALLGALFNLGIAISNGVSDHWGLVVISVVCVGLCFAAHLLMRDLES